MKTICALIIILVLLGLTVFFAVHGLISLAWGAGIFAALVSSSMLTEPNTKETSVTANLTVADD